MPPRPPIIKPLTEARGHGLRIPPVHVDSHFPRREEQKKMTEAGKAAFRQSQTLIGAEFFTLTPEDSLRRCPHCDKKQDRKHHVRGPVTINLSSPGAKILIPRVSNRDVWWNFGPIKWFIATASYDDPVGWYYVRHEVSCPTEGCPGHASHFIEEHSGFRKFGRARMFVILAEHFFMPNSLFLVRQDDPKESPFPET